MADDDTKPPPPTRQQPPVWVPDPVWDMPHQQRNNALYDSQPPFVPPPMEPPPPPAGNGVDVNIPGVVSAAGVAAGTSTATGVGASIAAATGSMGRGEAPDVADIRGDVGPPPTVESMWGLVLAQRALMEATMRAIPSAARHIGPDHNGGPDLVSRVTSSQS